MPSLTMPKPVWIARTSLRTKPKGDDADREPTGRRRASRTSGVAPVRGRLSVVEIVACESQRAEETETAPVRIPVAGDLAALAALEAANAVERPHVAILVADGSDGTIALGLRERLETDGARVSFVGLRRGPVVTERGPTVAVDVALGGLVPLCFDAVVVAPGSRAVAALVTSTRVLELLRLHARSGHVVGAFDGASALLEVGGVVALHPYAAPLDLPSETDAAATALVDRMEAARLVRE